MAPSTSSLLTKIAITIGGITILTPALFWGYILACMYWSLYIQATPVEPWNGCADPISQAELDAWVAHSEATGEPMCDPSVVNMTFDDTE